jgi:hypothetical protein
MVHMGWIKPDGYVIHTGDRLNDAEGVGEIGTELNYESWETLAKNGWLFYSVDGTICHGEHPPTPEQIGSLKTLLKARWARKKNMRESIKNMLQHFNISEEVIHD